MKQINPNVYPKGGHRYKDGEGTLHTADSWPGVIARVTAYRKRIGKPFDQVHDEVIAQACQNNPGLCFEDSPVRRARLKVASVKSRVLKWLSVLRDASNKNETVFVTEQLRDARADVCSRCPLDKSLPSGCASCKAALKELQVAIIGGRKGDGRFSACPVLGEYLPVSVWLESQTQVNAELPAECWRKRAI